MDFCHLHVHSDYSLLDGTAKVDALARTAAERGMSQIALTDHGNLFGVIPFYKACRKRGVKPLIGCETYMAPGPRTDRRRDPVTGVSSFHLTLIARDITGYRNLVELASTAYIDGFYYNPRIDHDALARHREGLVVLSGCFKGETSYYLRTGNERKAYEQAEWYRDTLGENYFVEIQRNGTPGQEENNQQLVRLARELRIPLVCTNDVHYISPDDALAQEVRMCIATGKTLEDEKRLKHESSGYYLRSAAEMWDLFRDVPEACEATLEIAARCDLEFEFGKYHLPRFETPEGHTEVSWFRHLCEKGLVERFGDPPPAAARERLEHEMQVIEKMGFVSYFLITWDFIRYARERSIPVGPGRGSAAGSLVSYVLRIVDVDPLRYDLLFERFLNSERQSMPDIDIDFCRDGRAEVIRYVTDKYGGNENVSQIITFGTLAARAVIRDVGRALNVPLGDVDMIAKKIPNGPGATLDAALEQDPDLAALRGDPRYAELFDVSLRLEGLHRHASTHAAGVVVGDGPLRRHVPLYRAGDDVVTQFTMEHLEEFGLLKMDFLGLKTLTVLDKCVKLVKATAGIDLDLAHLPLDDQPTWAMLQRGEALGIFQLESSGMRELLCQLRPDRFEDLIAVLALYRPGPLQTGMVDSFVRRKHGREEVTYAHPSLEPLLRDTYGTFVFQEQIMLIANRLAGFSPNEADGLRKAMGKKKIEVMLKYKEQFLDGCEKGGMGREVGASIWEVMEQFAKYAFNKSHTTAYAVVSYQTAYLKANHPVEFMAALMSCDMGNTDKVIAYMDECRRMQILVSPPDVNRSLADFSVESGEKGPVIRFGLAAVKGVGLGAVEAMVAARQQEGPFRSLSELCERVDLSHLNKATLEALVKAGALDGLGGHRAQIVAGLEGCMKAAHAVQEDRRAGQMSLFGSPAGGAAAQRTPRGDGALPDVPRWSETEMLAHEKEALGLYMSSHPLARHAGTLISFSDATTRSLGEKGGSARVVLGGMIGQLKTLFPKSGRNQHRKMARFRLEDFEGHVNCVLFADGYEQFGEHLSPEAIGLVEGTVDLTREEPDVKVDRFIPVERAFEELAAGLVLTPRPGEEEQGIETARRLMADHPGPVRVTLDLSPVPGMVATYRLTGGVAASGDVHRQAVESLGPAAVRWSARKATAGRAR